MCSQRVDDNPFHLHTLREAALNVDRRGSRTPQLPPLWVNRKSNGVVTKKKNDAPKSVPPRPVCVGENSFADRKFRIRLPNPQKKKKRLAMLLFIG